MTNTIDLPEERTYTLGRPPTRNPNRFSPMIQVFVDPETGNLESNDPTFSDRANPNTIILNESDEPMSPANDLRIHGSSYFHSSANENHSNDEEVEEVIVESIEAEIIDVEIHQPEEEQENQIQVQVLYNQDTPTIESANSPPPANTPHYLNIFTQMQNINLPSTTPTMPGMTMESTDQNLGDLSELMQHLNETTIDPESQRNRAQGRWRRLQRLLRTHHQERMQQSTTQTSETPIDGPPTERVQRLADMIQQRREVLDYIWQRELNFWRNVEERISEKKEDLEISLKVGHVKEGAGWTLVGR